MCSCLFGSAKLTRNADLHKYRYSGYGIGFDSRSEISLPESNMGKNVIIFGADMNASVHIDNKGKDTLILGEGPTQGLDDTILTAEAIYPINFTQPNEGFILILSENGSNSCSFVKDYALCLGNILNNFTIDDMKNTGLKWLVSFCIFINYYSIIDSC